jgi:hypothetical protein
MKIVLFLFSTKESLEILNNVDTWLFDATFKVAAEIFIIVCDTLFIF